MRGSGNNWLSCLTGQQAASSTLTSCSHISVASLAINELWLWFWFCANYQKPPVPLPAPGSGPVLAASQVTKDSSQEKARHETKTQQLGQQNMQIPHWHLPSHPIPSRLKLGRLTTIFGHSAWQTTKADPAIPERTTLHYCIQAEHRDSILLAANLANLRTTEVERKMWATWVGEVKGGMMISIFHNAIKR